MPGTQWLWSAEVEKFPSRVLAHRHPESVNLGDITATDFIDRARSFGHLNLLVAGTPCQAFSMAGNRRSLEDARGNLTLRFVEVVDAIEPDTVLWENVPGVLSTKDNAFGSFLAALVGADEAIVPVGGWTNAGMVSGPRRAAAWRVLDAQYFGLAQRRKRVFVVACPRNVSDPRKILFECEGVPRHSPPRREAGEKTAADVAERTGIGFEVGPGGGRDVDVACTMDARAKDGAIRNQVGMLAMSPIRILEPGARTGVSTDDVRCSDGIGQPGDPMFTLQRGKQHGVAFVQNTRDEVRMFDGDGQIVGALAAEPGAKQQCYVATVETSHCLNAGGMGRIDYETETLVVGALPSQHTPKGHGQSGVNDQAVAAGHVIPVLAPTLPAGRSGMGVGAVMTQIAQTFGVRRFTPRECERLQGFPDDYTAMEKAADGPRYKALGNSMAVPVIRWIISRIESVATLEPASGTSAPVSDPTQPVSA
jgi:DNA (cytosine-5)-methyltransferase 1